MATSRRHGSKIAFWNNTVQNAGDFSAYAEIGRQVDQFMIYIVVDKAATLQVQVAHSGADTPEGISTDPDDLALGTNSSWYDYSYQNNSTASGGAPGLFALAGAGQYAIGLPDWVAGFVRLKLTVGTTVTITAGWEAWGD